MASLHAKGGTPPPDIAGDPSSGRVPASASASISTAIGVGVGGAVGGGEDYDDPEIQHNQYHQLSTSASTSASLTPDHALLRHPHPARANHSASNPASISTFTPGATTALLANNPHDPHNPNNRRSAKHADEFPILCETCLGPNPYVRMLRDAWGNACKVCERPFTSFRWRPGGDGMRAKKTEVCPTCARAKNVCQTCLLDLEYGLPVQVRDALLNNASNAQSQARSLNRNGALVPQSDAVKEYTVMQTERLIADGVVDRVYGKDQMNERLLKRIKPDAVLSSSQPQSQSQSNAKTNAKKNAKDNNNPKKRPQKYDRNRVRVCSFFLKGKCTRGLYCPFRHETPASSNTTNNSSGGNGQDENDGGGNDDDGLDLDKQNLRDRYYGVNDPVAKKIIQRSGMVLTPDGKLISSASASGSVSKRAGLGRKTQPPPADHTIKTLFVGGVSPNVSEHALRAVFPPDLAASIVKVFMRPDRGFAFVEFASRQHAERAMQKCHGPNNVSVNGLLTAKLTINWGKSRPQNQPNHHDNNNSHTNPKKRPLPQQNRQDHDQNRDVEQIQDQDRDHQSQQEQPTQATTNSVNSITHHRPPHSSNNLSSPTANMNRSKRPKITSPSSIPDGPSE